MRTNSKILVPLIIVAVLIGVLGAYFSVEQKPAPDAALALSKNNQQVLEYWLDVIKEEGGKAAYEKFADTYKALRNGEQHEFAHIFGEALYKVEGVPGVAVCDSQFAFGCYHSFFGFALLDKGLDIIKDLDQACIDVYGRKGLGCQHGIGHGVITELGYDKLDESLEACMRLDWQEPIGGCTSGVFMEFNFATMDQGEIRQPEDKGEYYPCTEVEKRFSQACYFEQPAWWSVRSDQDFELVGVRCEAVADTLNREACYRGVGNVVAGMTEYSLDEITAACKLMPNEEGEILCIEGATWIVSAQPEFEDVWQSLCEPYTGDYYDRCIGSHDFI